MFENLQKFDTNLFFAINSHHSIFFDNIMWIVSGQIIWIPYFLLIVWLFYRTENKRTYYTILFLIITVASADLISVHLFKNVFHRLRPCHNEQISSLIHLVKHHCGGKYGFVSSHAANFFAVATFSAYIIKKNWYTILSFSIALIVIYSRVYLGVHYPADVLGGALLGFLLGFGFFKLYFLTLKIKK